MPAQFSPVSFAFAPLGRRKVVAALDGGVNSTDAGALLLGAADRAIKLISRFAACFEDARSAALIEHQVETLADQRVFGDGL